MEEGAAKWAFLDFRREEETSGLNFILTELSLEDDDNKGDWDPYISIIPTNVIDSKLPSVTCVWAPIAQIPCSPSSCAAPVLHGKGSLD